MFLFLVLALLSMIFTKRTSTSTSKTSSLKNTNWASRHSNFSSFQNFKCATTSRESSLFCKRETTTRNWKSSLKKKRLKVFVCKRCFIKFFNNIKFHEHIKNHYAKKFKIVLFTFFTLFILLAIFTFFVVFIISSQTSFISSQILSTSFATFFSTLNKIYLTMNNLFVMFIEKFKSLDLQYRSKNSFFSSRWQINKFSISQTRIILYFLFMTSKKSKKLNLIRQSNFVAKKLIDVERFDLKRVFSFFSIFFWISRIHDYFSWIFYHSNIWQKHYVYWHKNWETLR